MYYSQFGEDKILFEIFKQKSNGLCVEVGANNGVDDSTTLFFEKIGWQCILVEPNPTLCEQIRQSRTASVYDCAASNISESKTLYVVEGSKRSDGLSTISTKHEDHDRIKKHGFTSYPKQVQSMTLNDILMSAGLNREIDFISIDVEGHEYEVIEGFSLEKWKPVVILVEDNSNFENNNVSSYLKKFGYVRFLRTGVNDWYSHRTNKQLVNLKSQALIKCNIVKERLKNRKLQLKKRLKKTLFGQLICFFKSKVP